MKTKLCYTLFILILLMGCHKEDEGNYVSFCSVPDSNSKFAGVFEFNDTSLTSHTLRVSITDTIPGKSFFSLSLKEFVDHGDYLANTSSFRIFTMPVDDTTYLNQAGNASYLISYREEDCDALQPCSWDSDTTGYVYVEILDERNYLVDVQSRLVSDAVECKGNKFGDDSIKIRIKGVFTLF